MTFQVIGKGRLLAGQSSSIKIEQIFLNVYYFDNLDNIDVIDEAKDVENTTKENNDTFINLNEQDEPDPAIVDSKKRKNPSIIDWPGLEDGRIATA